MSGTIAALVFAAFSMSCNVGKEVKQTVQETTDKLLKSVDDTRASVETQSADWQTTTKNALDDAISGLGSATADVTSVLQQLINKLPEQVNATIRGEVTNLMQRAVASAGTEAKCTTDFLRVRVVEGLRYIKDKLMGIESAPPPPHICQVVPLVVDMSLPANSRNRIELYGFNMDRAPVRATIERGGAQVDITDRIDRPSHYHLTINLSGSSPLLDKASKRIRITTEGDTPHTIAVLQPEAKVCESKQVKTQAQTVTLRPEHQAGGRDFHLGDDSKTRFFGPQVGVTTVLQMSDDAIKAKIRVNAEVDAQGRRVLEQTLASNKALRGFPGMNVVFDNFERILAATARGEGNFDVYKAPLGWKITRVNTDARRSSFSYSDNDFEIDSFDQGAGGVVGRYVFKGAVKGQPDAGAGTQVDVTLNPIEVELQKDEDCVPPTSLRLSRAHLSKAAITKFNIQAMTATPAAALGPTTIAKRP
ncbi:MAG: hypothetical protein ACOY0T_21300 [Myxococcota bacterium]